MLVAAASGAIFVSPAGAAGKPKVGYLGVSTVGTTGATVETRIDPEGGDTTYEAFLECQVAVGAAAPCGPLTVSPQRIEGFVPADSESQTVAYSVSGLQPDYEYEFRLLATNAAGKAGFEQQGFLTCPLEGPCSEPYMTSVSWAAIESGELAAQRTLREAEQQRAEEAAARERERREASEHCVVPRLKGDSLPAARRALGGADCSLGRLTRRSKGRRRALVVVRQGAPVGRELAAGSRVAVTLGPRPRR